jgi:hypothetical protein
MLDLTALREEYANQDHDLSTTAECPFEQFQKMVWSGLGGPVDRTQCDGSVYGGS